MRLKAQAAALQVTIYNVFEGDSELVAKNCHLQELILIKILLIHSSVVLNI